MIIDFRYHITSLVAVFFALGVGILIGGAVLGNTALQQELNQIEQNLAKIRSDQRALEGEIAKRDADLRVLDQFGSSVMPVLVRNKLLGKRIALVRTNPDIDPRVARDLTRTFQLAGARVVSTTVILRNPAELTPEKLTRLGQRLDLPTGDAAALSRKIMAVMGDRIANGPMGVGRHEDTILNSLSNERLIDLNGDYGEMVDILVLVGGSQTPGGEASQQVDRPLIDAVSGAKGLLVAAVEPSNVARSYLSEYLQHSIIVVDNADTVVGQTALVMALVRGKKGHYGIKGAHQLLPEIF